MIQLKKTIKNGFYIGGLILITVLGSCTKKKTETVTPIGAYETGVFIVNEGPFNSGTGTISHYNKTTGLLTNNIFQLANQIPLGNIVQSINFINNQGYIVVNNANKIEIVEGANFTSTGTINGLESPRSILAVSPTKAYVTEWGFGTYGKISIINLLTNSITGDITINRKGPENMIKKGDLVYVTCKGAYGTDSVVTIIDSKTNTVVKNLKVGANPDDIKEDKNGDIWVLCSGKYKSDNSELEIPGSLVKINPTDNTVETAFLFSSLTSQPAGLELNSKKDKLFYNYNGSIYSHSSSSSNLDNQIVVNKNFYSIGIDPTTNIIYAGDAGDYSSNGKVFRYTLNGIKIDEMTVGIIPGNFYFR